VPPGFATVMAAHRQAYEVASLARDDSRRKPLGENDPGRRIALAARLGLVADALAHGHAGARAEPQTRGASGSRRRRSWRSATAARSPGGVRPSASSRAACSSRASAGGRCARPDLERWREIRAPRARRRGGHPTPLERSFVLAGYPTLAPHRLACGACGFRADLAPSASRRRP
jgi:hypothetical protein